MYKYLSTHKSRKEWHLGVETSVAYSYQAEISVISIISKQNAIVFQLGIRICPDAEKTALKVKQDMQGSILLELMTY